MDDSTIILACVIALALGAVAAGCLIWIWRRVNPDPPARDPNFPPPKPKEWDGEQG